MSFNDTQNPLRTENELTSMEMMYNALIHYEIENNVYLNKDTALNFIKNNLNLFEIGEKNLCLECGEDMGLNNPRQLCGKTKCYNKVE